MKLFRLCAPALAIMTAVLAGCSSGAISSFSPSSVLPGATSSERNLAYAGSGGALGPLLTSANSGTITGWDIDQTKDIGLLSAGYKDGTSLETFDLKTAKITKLGSYQKGGSGSITRQLIVLRILANDVALVDDLKFVYNGFQRDDAFFTVSPIAKARLTARWTPPHRKDLIITPSFGYVSVNQDTSTNVIFGNSTLHRSKGGVPEVIESDVAKDTFTRPPHLGPDEVFQVPFIIAQDTVANQAIVPMQIEGSPFNPFESPSFVIDDLTTKKQTIFSPNLGSGSVMGAAIDSTTHMMCTTTSDDSNVEFINLSTRSGFAQNIPNGVGEGSGGAAVAVDALHHLFLVTQPEGSLLDTSTVYVYDEGGNLKKTIPGFNFENAYAALFAYVAVNPNLRIGYATTANAAQLQSFKY